MSFVYLLFSKFQQGGLFMYPILFVMMAGTAIIIERIIVLKKAYQPGGVIWHKVRPLITKGQYKEAHDICRDTHTSLGKVFAAGLDALITEHELDEVQDCIDEVMLEQIPVVERRMQYLPILANVATLCGLLGTVIGLIEAFQAIGVAEPSQKAKMLAEGVAVAMNATAFGLVTAIPFLLIHSYLESIAMKTIDNMEEYTIKLNNLLKKHKK